MKILVSVVRFRPRAPLQATEIYGYFCCGFSLSTDFHLVGTTAGRQTSLLHSLREVDMLAHLHFRRNRIDIISSSVSHMEITDGQVRNCTRRAATDRTGLRNLVALEGEHLPGHRAQNVPQGPKVGPLESLAAFSRHANRRRYVSARMLR